MLTLEPPYYEIGGTLVYRDHAIANQFYYTAPPPKLVRTNGQLMFDLMMYSVELKHSVLAGTTIPDELGAGFLTMGVDCALTESQRTNLSRDLAARTKLPEAQIALYPVPYHKGTVKVLALDQFSTPGEPTGDVASTDRLKGRPTFVEQVLGSATPSLLGNLRSIFSLCLSQTGVAFLEGLYKDKAAPIGIVYELKFYGLRPAVEAKITANLARIYQHFGGGLSGQYSWVKADISAGVDYLQETGDVKIELTSQAVGDAAEKSKELALSLFKDRIIQELFRPTAPTPNVPSSAAGSVGSALGTANTSSSGGSIGLTLAFRRSEELKTITYDFRERSPEERTHAPQGFLPVLLSKTELQKRIHQVDLKNDFFELLNVLVTGPTKAEFETLNIRQIEATLTYGEPTDVVPPERQSLLFRADSTGDKTFAVKRRGRKSLAYNCTLNYEFTRQTGTDSDRVRYELPQRSCTGRSLQVNPYVDFGVLDVEVEPGRLHPDIREIDLLLAYRSPDNRFSAEERMRFELNQLESLAQRRHWQVRTQQTDLNPYLATPTFVFQDGTIYTPPAQAFSDPLLKIDSPFQHDRRLLLQPNALSAQINQITVELEYHDPENNYHRQLLVPLEAPFSSKEIRFPMLNPNLQTIRYRVTVHEPGFISEGEWLETTDPSIVVGGPVSRLATVQVRLIGASLAEVGLDAVELKLQLMLAGKPFSEPQSLLIEASQPTSQDVKLVLPPGATLRYRYQTTSYKASGAVVESVWKESTNALLVISTRSL